MSKSYADMATKNVISSVIQSTLNVIITLLSRIVFVYVLNESYLGISGLFSNILSILSVADLGMSTVMMFRLYQPIAENNIRKIQQLVALFKKMYLCIAFAVLALGLAIMPFLENIINLEEKIPFLYGYYVLALLNVFISYLFVYRTTLVMADQKNYLLNRCSNIFKIITFVLQTIILITFKQYFLYLLVALFTSLMCNFWQNKIALQLYPYLKEPVEILPLEDKKSIFTDIKAMFLYRIAGVIQSNTDSILTSIFVGTVYVGYYSNYLLISTAIVNILTLVFNNLKASIGNMLADKYMEKENKQLLFWNMEFVNYWLVAFFSIVFVMLSSDFICICFGKTYELPLVIVILMVFNFYTSNIRQTLWAFRETTGLFHQTRYITLITAVINLFLSIIMGYFWGMAGIILATVIARLIYAWWKEPQILFANYFYTSAACYYKKYIKRLCLCVTICWVTYFVCSFISVQNIYLRFIIKTGICCILPNLIWLSVYYKTEEFKYFYNKIIKRIMKKRSRL